MASDSINKVSQIIEIEDDIIDLDEADKTPEEVIYEWDAKIRKKLSESGVADNENILGDLMKEYLQTLEDMTRSYEDNETLKNKVFCHISFLYSYFVELQCCTADNYLTIMEDILTLYCNLALEVIHPLRKKDYSEHKYKKRIVSVGKKLIHVLTVYLLERHDHILHVLIKMNANKISDPCCEVLKLLYRHFLIRVPAFDLSDESFCRSYIVFQKWKQIRNTEDWEGIDKCMYKMFKRTPESVKNSEVLRTILMPSCAFTADVIVSLFRSHQTISNAYFQHMTAKRNIEFDDLDFNIDLGEDEPIIPANNDNEEEVQFLKAYYEVERNMSNLSHVINGSDIPEMDMFRKCKEELEEDDDVQFISITMPDKPILHNLLSDELNDSMSEKATLEETERIELPTPPLQLDPTVDKNPDLENLNGMTKIRVGTPRTVSETSSSCQSLEVERPNPTKSTEDVMTLAQIAPEISQPEVSFAPDDIPPAPGPLSQTETTTEPKSDKILNKPTIEMRSVEVQADKVGDYLYNEYGVTTPPFEGQGDEQSSASVECRIFARQDDKITPPAENEKRLANTRTVEVQVDLNSRSSSSFESPSYEDIDDFPNYFGNIVNGRVRRPRSEVLKRTDVKANADPLISQKNCPYNDYGLTPPSDTHLEDSTPVLQEPLYTDLGRENLSSRKDEASVSSQSDDKADDVAQENTETETENDPNSEVPNLNEGTDLDSEVNDPEFEDQLDIPEANLELDEDTEEIDVETCQETDNTGEENNEQEEETVRIALPRESDEFKKSDQIDTGQIAIENSAPSIAPVTAESELKDLSAETYNGNTVLKPLSSNRTNGQAKDNPISKIIYTSSQRLRPTLDDFDKFENDFHRSKENQDFDDILSGPVSKAVPVKPSSLYAENMDLFGQEPTSKPTVPVRPVVLSNPNSRSNSPNESPAYETMDDFPTYYNYSVNRGVSPPQDPKVPQSILKKGNKTRRKAVRISFDPSTYVEDRRPRDGIAVSRDIIRDTKLNMKAEVLVERLSFIEEKLKYEKCFVKYDKSNTLLSEKDERRYIPDPKLTWIIKSAPSKHSAGSLSVNNRELRGKKPKKRKFEPQTNSLNDPVVRKRAFRTPEKESIAPRRRGRPSKISDPSKKQFVSKGVSEFDELLNSGAYSNKPFRLDLPA